MAAFSHNGEPGSALDRELRGLNCVRCDRLSSDLAARDAELAELMKWKAAVVNELIVAHIYSQVHDDSPRKAVHDAITWNCQVALDPLVSSDAQRLRDTYLHRAEAAERRLKLYEPIHTFDGLTIEEWKRKAEEAARDSARLDYLEHNPRHAQIIVSGVSMDCVFYGISTAELVPLRSAIDSVMAAIAAKGEA